MGIQNMDKKATRSHVHGFCKLVSVFILMLCIYIVQSIVDSLSLPAIPVDDASLLDFGLRG